MIKNSEKERERKKMSVLAPERSEASTDYLDVKLNDAIESSWEDSVKGWADFVRDLIKKGAKKDKPSTAGSTPLMRAIVWGNYEAVKTLIEEGVDVNRQDQKGDTALHMTADAGYTKMVQMLLQNGADPKIKNIHGETALNKARKKGNHGSAHFIEESLNRKNILEK